MKASSVLIAALAVAMTSCGNDKPETPTPAAAAAPAATPGLIAYVDIDTLQQHYQFYQEGKNALEQKVNAYQASASQQENRLQQMQAEAQKKMQQGQITTQEEYEQELARFQRQQEAYARYVKTTEEQLAQEQMEFNQALQDSLDNFLREFNASKKYSIILNKAVMLYADPAMDITAEVVAGLNKRYLKK